MLFKKAIEALHLVIAQKCCDRTDLGGREDAEKPLRESETNLNLALHHCFLVFAEEGPLQCSYLHPEFSRYRCDPQLHIAVRSMDEVMHKPGGTRKKGGWQDAADALSVPGFRQ